MKNHSSYRYQRAVFVIVMMSGCAIDAQDNAPEAETTVQALAPGGCTQQVQLGTLYFSDAGETNWVGQCTITCAQFVRGTGEPYPGQGGTCQGNTSTSYQAPLIGTCHGCRE